MPVLEMLFFTALAAAAETVRKGWLNVPGLVSAAPGFAPSTYRVAFTPVSATGAGVASGNKLLVSAQTPLSTISGELAFGVHPNKAKKLRTRSAGITGFLGIDVLPRQSSLHHEIGHLRVCQREQRAKVA